MAWHDETPWARKRRDQTRAIEVAGRRMKELARLCQDWVVGDLDATTAIEQARQVIEGDADRVIRCE